MVPELVNQWLTTRHGQQVHRRFYETHWRIQSVFRPILDTCGEMDRSIIVQYNTHPHTQIVGMDTPNDVYFPMGHCAGKCLTRQNQLLNMTVYTSIVSHCSVFHMHIRSRVRCTICMVGRIESEREPVKD